MDPSIQLQEQTACPVVLTRSEAQELQALNMEVIRGGTSCDQEINDAPVEIPITGGDLYFVNPKFRVGHFRLSSEIRRTVRVRPKVEIRNVFSLLGAAYRLYSRPGESPFRSESVSYAVDRARLLEPLVHCFNEAIKELLQEGLLSSYIEQEQNLKALRGRIAFSKQLSQNLIRSDRLYCRFFQSEVDIPENQLILWTMLLVNRAGEWAKDIRQVLNSHILHFGGVSVRRFLPRQYPAFHYDRLSSRYGKVHDWCKLFIDLLSISDKPGETTFNGYRLDMNELFERFVFSTFERAREVVPSFSVTRLEEHDLDLEGKVGICPDLTLRGPNQATVAVDAKYKRTEGAGRAKHPDLYQVISYATALGLIGQESTSVQAVLVYPATERTIALEDSLRVITSKRISSQLTIRVLWLDLDCEDPVREADRKIVSLLKEILN